MVASAAGALDAAALEHWFFGGWAVDLWVGRLTRAHDDIDVLVWREDEAPVQEELQAAGWSTRRLLRTWSARTTHAMATSSSSPSGWPAPKEVSSCRFPSNRWCSRAARWPSHAGS